MVTLGAMVSFAFKKVENRVKENCEKCYNAPALRQGVCNSPPKKNRKLKKRFTFAGSRYNHTYLYTVKMLTCPLESICTLDVVAFLG